MGMGIPGGMRDLIVICVGIFYLIGYIVNQYLGGDVR